MQRDADVEATLLVDRRNSGVYDYLCAYALERGGTVHLRERRVWQSYTDAVPSAVYDALREVCGDKITRVTALADGYLVSASPDPVTTVFTEVDESLSAVFTYEFRSEDSVSTVFLSGDTLCIVSFDGAAERTNVTRVDKVSGAVRVGGFTFRDLAPDCGADDSTGGFLFDGARMWLHGDVLCFAETYYKGGSAVALGAFDLAAGKAVHFTLIENAQVILARKEPDAGRVAVLVNPMDYQPLSLYTVDDTTLEVQSVTPLALPNEFLTRQNSAYAAPRYYLFEGDMDAQRVAVLFGDVVSREPLEDDTASSILVVYDRASGAPLTRARLRLASDYELIAIALTPEA